MASSELLGGPRTLDTPPFMQSKKGIPKMASIAKDCNNFTSGELDFGHMDIWVDDGNAGGLDSHTRQMRFSSAASNIDELFRSPRSSFAEVEEEDVAAFKEVSEQSSLLEPPRKESPQEQDRVGDEVCGTQDVYAIELMNEGHTDVPPAEQNMEDTADGFKDAEHLELNNRKSPKHTDTSSEGARKAHFKRLLNFFEMGAIESLRSDSILDALMSKEESLIHEVETEVATTSSSQPDVSPSPQSVRNHQNGDVSPPSRPLCSHQNSDVCSGQVGGSHENNHGGILSRRQNRNQGTLRAVRFDRSIEEAVIPVQSDSVIDIEPLTLSNDTREDKYNVKKEMHGEMFTSSVGKVGISGGEFLLSKTSAESSPSSSGNVASVKKMGHGVNSIDNQSCEEGGDIKRVNSQVEHSNESHKYQRTFNRLKKLGETVRMVISGEAHNGHAPKHTSPPVDELEGTRTDGGAGRPVWSLRAILPRLRLTNMLGGKEHRGDANIDIRRENYEGKDVEVRAGGNDNDKENMHEERVPQHFRESTTNTELQESKEESSTSAEQPVVPLLLQVDVCGERATQSKKTAEGSENSADDSAKSEAQVAGIETAQVTEEISGTEDNWYTPNESSWMLRRLLSPRNSSKNKNSGNISAKDMASWPANAPTLYICTKNGPCIVGEPSPWAPKHVRDAISFKATDLKNEDSLVNLNAEKLPADNMATAQTRVNEKKVLSTPRQVIAKLMSPRKRFAESEEIEKTAESSPSATKAKNKGEKASGNEHDTIPHITPTGTIIPERIRKIFTPRMRSPQRHIPEFDVSENLACGSGENKRAVDQPVSDGLSPTAKRNASEDNTVVEDVAKVHRNILAKLKSRKVTVESPKTASTEEQAWAEDKKARDEGATVVSEATTPKKALRNKFMTLVSPRTNTQIPDSVHIIPGAEDEAKATQLEERFKDEFGVVAGGESEAEVGGAVIAEDMLAGLHPDPARGAVVSERGTGGKRDGRGSAEENENSWLPNWGIRRLFSQLGLNNGS